MKKVVSKKRKQPFIDNSMVVTRGKGRGEVGEGKGVINGDGRRLDFV